MKNSILFCFLLLSLPAFAQTTLRGRVSDQVTGTPLSGATIIVNTDHSKIASNNYGEFEISLPQAKNTLTVSYIGYETQYVPVNQKTENIAITLIPVSTNLNSIIVTGFENNRKLTETAGSLSVLKQREITRGDNMDIMNALNTVPGVKMEAFVTGNYRISIRGSLLNNPWGIRNVKIYWNDIPLSSPDGTASQRIDFDPAMIGSVEVLKGPSGSTYGAGNGGVILFKTNKASSHQNQLETSFTAGSYGFIRSNTNYKTGTDKYSIAASYTRQRYDGYRENEWSNKDVINIFSQFTPSTKRTVNVFVNHATGSFGIAGQLDSSQVKENRRQAASFSKENKTAGRKYNFNQFGASQTYHFSDHFYNTTGLFGSFKTYDHPFGTGPYYNGYLKESAHGYGVRSKFVYAPKIGSIQSRFTAGIESMYQHQTESTYRIINDAPGTWPETGSLYQDLITVSRSNIIFAQAEFDLPAQFLLTAGASYNQLTYDITDLYRDSTHVDYSGIIKFPKKISPRIGLVKILTKAISAHASLSYGYAPPPLWEINNFDGTLNKSIRPEDGRNIELGIRGSVLQSKLSFDISVYQMNLTNTIIPVANQYGISSYRNAGATNQKGLEGNLVFTAVRDNLRSISLLSIWSSAAFNHYKFKNYTIETFDWSSNSIIKSDYSGKKVTGVVPVSISGGIDSTLR